MVAEEGPAEVEEALVGEVGGEELGLVDDPAQAVDAGDADAVALGADGGEEGFRLGAATALGLDHGVADGGDLTLGDDAGQEGEAVVADAALGLGGVHGDSRAMRPRTRPAASTVRSTISSVCRVDRKPASKAEGAR